MTDCCKCECHSNWTEVEEEPKKIKMSKEDRATLNSLIKDAAVLMKGEPVSVPVPKLGVLATGYITWENDEEPTFEYGSLKPAPDASDGLKNLISLMNKEGGYEAWDALTSASDTVVHKSVEFKEFGKKIKALNKSFDKLRKVYPELSYEDDFVYKAENKV